MGGAAAALLLRSAQRAAPACKPALARGPLRSAAERWPLLTLAAPRTCTPRPRPAPAGPRIFVGKLNKETTEQDVKDYFIRFGYVMDVYLPRGELRLRCAVPRCAALCCAYAAACWGPAGGGTAAVR